mgnify:CR=1 FL=1
MMSNSVFQSVMVQLKDVTDREFGVIDAEGFVVSSTDLTLQGERWPDAVGRIADSTDGCLFYRERYFRSLVNGNNAFEYAVFCTGEDEQAKTYCNLAYISLSEAKAFYEEKHDRGTFVKNIIMDNILPGDIYLRAKELHFSTESPRAVFLVRQVGHTDVGTLDVVTNLFPDRLQDFVLSINEADVAVVKQINGSTTEEDLERLWNESPLKYAPACRTPTLFIHSDQDFRCPMPDALEMFS